MNCYLATELILSRNFFFSFYAQFIQNFWKFLISIKYQILKNNNNKKDSLVTVVLWQGSEEQHPLKRFWQGWPASSPHEVSLWTAMLWKSHKNVIKNPGKHFSRAWIQIFHFHGLFFQAMNFLWKYAVIILRKQICFLRIITAVVNTGPLLDLLLPVNDVFSVIYAKSFTTEQ